MASERCRFVVTGGPGGSWEGILMPWCSGAVDQAWCLIVHCSERVEALTLVFVHAEWSFPPSDLNGFSLFLLGAALVFCIYDNSDYSSLYPNICLSRASEEKEERKKMIQGRRQVYLTEEQNRDATIFWGVETRWSLIYKEGRHFVNGAWGVGTSWGAGGPWTSTTLSQNFTWLLWPYLMCRNNCYWVI